MKSPEEAAGRRETERDRLIEREGVGRVGAFWKRKNTKLSQISKRENTKVKNRNERTELREKNKEIGYEIDR